MHAMITAENNLIEILVPSRRCHGQTKICDCCQQARNPKEFEDDAFGICAECLTGDTPLADLDAFVDDENWQDTGRSVPNI